MSGRTALITGGTSGIGEATARLFHAQGANVMIVGRSAERGRRIAQSMGDRAAFCQADVRDEGDIANSVEATVAKFGSLNVLFNNAGGPTAGDIESVTPAQFRDAMDLLVGSVLFGIKHAVPVMRRAGGGAIINNSSVAALRCHMGDYLYSTAKAAVTHLTRLAGMELGRHGITVNSVSPGAIVTPIFLGGASYADSLPTTESSLRLDEVEETLRKSTPVLEAGSPYAIAEAVLFLASIEGKFVNCHDLVVDGGMIAGGKTRYAR